MSVTGAAAAPAGEEPSLYYFKERRPLSERTGELAILDGQGDAQGNFARSLKSAGLDVRSFRDHAIPGWRIAELGAAPDPREAVRKASAALPSQFVSPVFANGKGGPLFPTPVLLVRFEEGVPEARAEEILRQAGGTVLERGWARMPGAYRIDSHAKDGYGALEAAARLAVLPEVRFAEPDMVATGRSVLTPTDPRFGESWGLHNTGQSGGVADEDMDAPEAWDLETGSQNVRVLVLDVGVQQNHPDLNQNAGFDATGENGGGGPVNICDNHGTAVAGCISAAMNNGLGTTGIAPNCRVVSARFAISNVSPTNTCDGSWSTQFSWTVNCLTFAENSLIRITNNSNAFDTESSAITDKYNSTYAAAGMIHFASAGNDASATISYPARLTLVNSVAALNRNGGRASFSNFGVGLDVTAPGEAIVTTDRTGANGYNTGGDYATVDGTSFASPYAAGVAALMLSAEPGQANFILEDRLYRSCTDKGAGGYDTSFGWGVVNARGALDRVCLFTLSDLTQSFGNGGGIHAFNVQVTGGCDWTAVVDAPWVTITAGGSGTGTGTVSYSVAPNAGPFRIANITVHNQVHRITQASADPLPNDIFASAFLMSGPAGTVTGNNIGAGKEPGEPNHGGQPGGASVWWNWTAPGSGPVVITTDGSNFDTVLGVYMGSTVSGLTFVAGDDDSGEGNRSRVTFNATRGALYRIAVDGVNGAPGSITLNWNLSPLPATTHNSNQSLAVASEGPGFQVLFFNYTTSALAVSPFQPTSAKAFFTQPPAEWIGLFLYDYGPGAFTEAVYRTNQGI